ncbi:MAG TPA: transferrin receptor-like dimerization domain-containing protein, partial [Pyrinomonadaceae bacterium]|nr:transferrin receptor-like dimerization domain-containing protein [Pyrinomonadaceae bacterium]
GWQPRRTIILCSWDAEEYGLEGSTEWAEEHDAELQQKAVAYLNVDVAVNGPNYSASSVPSLWKLIRSATREIKDPKTGKTVYQQWQDHTREQRNETDSDYDAEARISPLGSGSDYTPFLQHLGIASTDMGFGGDYGVYHSAFDSFTWMSKFGDPDFTYHVAAAQLWGTMAMRLASADGLQFDYRDYADAIREYFDEAMKLASRRKLDSALDEKPMNDAIKSFADEANRIERERQQLVAQGGSSSAAKLRRLNDALILAERAFIDDRGLNDRPWYKHEIYAPGIFTGYASQPLTDFRQALDDRNTTNLKEGLVRIVAAINRATEVLKKARD